MTDGGMIGGADLDRWTRLALDVVGELPRADPLFSYVHQVYSPGISRYTDALRSICFSSQAKALDVGSGPGQWCVALAALNCIVEGVEPRDELVALSERVIDRLELTDQVRIRQTRIEDVELPPESLDLVVCHGVLMYTDHELALTKIAQGLRPGGRLYCGYTVHGSRLQNAVEGAARSDWQHVRAMLAITLSAEIYRLGLHHVLGSQVRALQRDVLERLAEQVGLIVIERPEIQDRAGDWLGYEMTFDFVASRSDSPAVFERRLAAIEPEAGWPQLAREIALAGAPRMALRLLDQVDISPEARAARLVALIKLGEVRGREALLSGLPAQDEARLRARFWLQSHNFDRALAEFARIDHTEPDDEFLIACALLGQGRLGEAEAMFASQLRRQAGDLRALCGAGVSALDAGCPQAAATYLDEFVANRLASNVLIGPATRDAAAVYLQQIREVAGREATPRADPP